MSVYLDTSVIVSLFTADDHSAQAEAWLMQGHDLLVSHWVATEFSSALALQRRRGDIDARDAFVAEQAFDQLLNQEILVEAVQAVDVIRARRLVVEHDGLRAPEALHLAIAERLGCVVATFDQVLGRAAAAVGVDVLAA